MKTALKPLAIAVMTAHLAACMGESQTPQGSIEAARAFIANDDLKAAKITLMTATKENPEDAKLRLELAQVLFQAGDFPGAQKEVLKAAELGITPAQTQPLLAQSLYRQYRYRDVIALEQEIAEGLSPPDRAIVFSMIGRSFLALLNARAAQVRIENALEEDPQSVAAMTAMAGLQIYKKHADKGLAWAQQATAIDPESAEAWATLATAQSRLDQPEAAIESFGRAIGARPYVDMLYVSRALLLMQQGQLDAAAKDIDTMARSPYRDFWYTLYVKGRIQFAQGKYQDAIFSFDQALARTTHAESQFYAAIAHGKLGNYEQARLLAEQAVLGLRGYAEPVGLLGELSLMAGNPEQGYDLLEKLIAADPTNSTALRLLGTAYIRDGNYDKGIPVLEQLLAVAPELEDIQQILMMARIQSGADLAVLEEQAGRLASPFEKEFWLAYAYLQRGEHAEARARALTLWQANPDQIDPAKLIVASYAGERDWANARKTMAEVIAATGGGRLDLQNMVALDIAASDFPAARKSLAALLQRYGDDTQAALFAYAQYKNLGDAESADQVLQQAFADNPGELRLRTALMARHFDRGEYRRLIELAQVIDEETLGESTYLLELYGKALERSGQRELALDRFNQLRQLQPGSVRFQMLYAETLERLGSAREAEAAFAQAASMDPDNYDITLQRLRFLISQRKLPEARQLVTLARAKHGNDARLLAEEGPLYLFEGDAVAAGKTLEKAYQLAPSRQSAIWLSRAYVLQQQFDQALQALDRWLAKHPQDLYPLMDKAGVFLSQQKEAEALAVYREVVRHHPDYIPALNNAAWFSRKVDLDYALATAERAYSLQPEDSAVLDTLGYLQLQAGQHAAALSHLQRASQLAPDVPEIQLHLAQALAKNGQKRKAERVLQDLIAGPAGDLLKAQATQELESLAP